MNKCTNNTKKSASEWVINIFMIIMAILIIGEAAYSLGFAVGQRDGYIELYDKQ